MNIEVRADDTVVISGYVNAVERESRPVITPYGKVNELVDEAVKAVASGTSSYSTEIYSILKDSSLGLKVQYDSGYKRRLDSALRQNIIDGSNAVYKRIEEQMGEELGFDGVEITAHNCPAPDHAPYQGKQYSNKEYEALQNSLHRKIDTWNCRHKGFGIILGVSQPVYDDKTLNEYRAYADEKVNIDGKDYTRYEVTQMQRKLENKIRDSKEKQILAKACGNEELMSKCQRDITVYTTKYRQITAKAGLENKLASRGRVQGYKRGKVSVQDKQLAVFDTKDSTQSKGNFDLETTKAEYAKFLQDMPPTYKEKLENAFNEVAFKEIDLKNITIAYSPKNDTIVINTANKFFKDVDLNVALTHELAHKIDFSSVKSWQNTGFKQSIINSYDIFKSNSSDFIKYCDKNDKLGYLSDILDAICQSEFELPYSHNKEYWAIPESKEKEIFANLFSMNSLKDIEGIEFLKTNFVELYEHYLKLIGD